MVQVLIVDDDKPTRDVLRFMLEEEGYIIAEAADGTSALNVLRASVTPLITLLDLDLPHADGVAVLNAVAATPTLTARHRFILLTAVSRRRVQEADEICARLGVPIQLKPFEMDDLLRAIADAAGTIVSPGSEGVESDGSPGLPDGGAL